LLDTSHPLEKFYPHVSKERLERQYWEHLSDFGRGKQREWLVFPENVGLCLSIDETAILDGELGNNR
jgi:hypothetical protein